MRLSGSPFSRIGGRFRGGWRAGWVVVCIWSLVALATWGMLVGRRNLEVAVLGCEELHADGLCEYRPEQPIRLFITAEPTERLVLFDGLRTVPTTDVVRDSGHLLAVDPRGRHGTLTLVSSAGLRVRVFRFKVRAEKIPAWLTVASELRQQNRTLQAEALLRQHASQPSDLAQQVRILSLLARIEFEQGRFSDAERSFSATIKLAESAGLLTHQNEDTLWLAELLSHQQGRFADAERLHDALQKQKGRPAELRPWELLQLAKLRLLRGNFRRANDLLVEAEHWAEQIDAPRARTEVQMVKADLLQRLGRSEEADRVLGTLGSADLSPCLRAEVLALQGTNRLLRREGQTLATEPPTVLSPLPPLQAALDLLKRQCEQPPALTSVLIKLARAAVLDRDLDAAQRFLSKAHAILPEGNEELQLASRELAVEQALAIEDVRNARLQSALLIDAARSAGAVEMAWRGLIGLAHADEKLDSEAALISYRKAEAYLDRLALELNLELGRASFLGRFQRGTATFLDLLLRSGRAEEALQVIRHARLRNLSGLLQLERIDQLSEPQRRQWEAALNAYRTARVQVDKLASQGEWASALELKALANERSALQSTLMAKLEDAIRVLGEPFSDQQMRAPEPGEAILTCHPGLDAWLCFVRDERGLGSARFKELKAEAQLLAPFDEILSRTRHLRVLLVGTMDRIDFSLIPFHGRPLYEHMTVVYSLDLPTRSRVAPLLNAGGNGRALLVADPQGNLPWSRHEVERIATVVRKEGLTPTTLTSRPQELGTWPGMSRSASKPLSSDLLRKQLSEAELFHFSGHADSLGMPDGLHALRTGDSSVLTTGDILSLSHIPRMVTLFACQSGISAGERGGNEGLGLAQAFLLRGSELAIGSVRPVQDRETSELAVALYESGLGARNTDPLVAWRKVLARSELREALSAFRIYVP